MSNASVGDSDIDQIDLTSDDDDHSDLDDHEDATPVPEPIILQVDDYGAPVLHIVNGPEAVDPMDLDDAEVPDDGDQEGAGGEEDGLFVEQDGNVGQPPSPPSSDNSDSDADDSDSDDEDEGDDGYGNGGGPGDNDLGDEGGDDEDEGYEVHGNGGDPGDNDSGDDGSNDGSSDSDESSDTDSSNESDDDDDDLFDDRNPDADLMEALEEAEVEIPQWAGNCRATCRPHWLNLGDVFLLFRRLFLNKKIELASYKARNRTKVRGLNQTIRALKEAVNEFYAANRSNIAVNHDLNDEIEDLRALLSQEQLADLPERDPLPLQDMRASLPQEILALLPPDIQPLLRTWRRSCAKPRHTERLWPKVYRAWISRGRYRGFTNWGDVYKLSCKEENMSWAFGKNMPPKTHPHLKLRPPTAEEELRAIGGEGCSPQPDQQCKGPKSDESICPFRFEYLPGKIQLKILRYALVFGGEVVHPISRLDPYYEPSSIHTNCNGELSLIHRFHIGKEEVSLTFGVIHPQRLLAPLQVCKQWNLIGTTFFYGANKFAFSSIGE
ncbi:hypothetical protein FSARC_14266 [Fusarium sarcochroum]|uniref:Uncharacterized protein n=1 Tax=Fusarium sarcochroum TaxID=1208366 RepID=A0A8H4SUK0_9HYPO|nr:hypothetical protein FSARC_14266 [Fusarium sarcochroum]